MEKNITKIDLQNPQNNLMLEYNYYLDLLDKVKKLGTYSIVDYENAIKNYTDLKKQYRRNLIIACTLSTVGMAGLAAISVSSSKEPSIISMFGAFGAFMGFAGGYGVAGEYFLLDNSKELAVNNSIESLKEKQRQVIEETNILFKNSTNLISLAAERKKIETRLELLECAINYIKQLESNLMKKYFSDKQEGILYGEEDLTTSSMNIRNELSYGYYLVKSYL